MNLKQIAALAATTLGLLAACGGGAGGGIGGTGSTAGTLRVSLTDAPACGYDAVNVTIEKVRVHRSATAADSDAGWSELVLPTPRRVDLLTLQNGVLDELGELPLPEGAYTQLRLVLAENTASKPLANSVVPTGALETPLETPSAQQSGLKMNVNIDVPAGKVVDVVLDFDACKSVVKRGNSGRYNLKPVVTVIPRLSDAGLRIVGWVDPSIAASGSGTSVSVQADGVPVKATVPDSSGKFVLYPVPVGSNYTLVVRADGRVTAVMTGVPVSELQHTFVNSELVRINPAPLASSPLSVPGNVSPASASVRALQTLGDGTVVEVEWGQVDADTGDFTFTLPLDAPHRTAYVANPLVLLFAPDDAVAGFYRLEARSGASTLLQDLNLNLPFSPVAFTFP